MNSNLAHQGRAKSNKRSNPQSQFQALGDLEEESNSIELTIAQLKQKMQALQGPKARRLGQPAQGSSTVVSQGKIHKDRNHQRYTSHASGLGGSNGNKVDRPITINPENQVFDHR